MNLLASKVPKNSQKTAILTIHIIEGRDLGSKNPGKTDVYCEIQLYDEFLHRVPGTKYLTSSKKNTLNPTWDTAVFHIEVGMNWHLIKIRCYNAIRFAKEFLGEVMIPAHKIVDSPPIDALYKLKEKNRTHETQGALHLKIKYTPFNSSNSSTTQTFSSTVASVTSNSSTSSMKDDPSLFAERENWKINPEEITFEKDGLLGQGAQGRVDLAIWREAKVAVKTLFEPMGEDQDSDEFYQELHILCRLRHPNIVQLLGYYFTPTSQHLVTEYLEGSSLRDLLQKNRDQNVKLEQELFFRIATDITKGMIFLHTSKPPIIHRDLKPGNILLASQSISKTSATAKIADFGISKDHDPNCLHTKQKGTIAYMAPEIFQSQSYSPKVDVYAFGVVLWEMITGQKPWLEYRFRWQIEEAIVQGTRPPLPKDCPETLRKLVDSCWDGSETNRPEFSSILPTLTAMINEFCDKTLHTLFKERDKVPWPEFNAYARDQLKTDQREIDILKPVLCEGNDENAVRSAFAELVQWFGPIGAEDTYEANSDLSDGSSLAYIAFLYKQPWFHGKIDAVTAINKLSKYPSGSFLVRLSSEPGIFTLSFNAHGRIYHKRIVFKNGHYLVNGESFDHLRQVVTHYSSVFIDPTRKITLKTPCTKD